MRKKLLLISILSLGVSFSSFAHAEHFYHGARVGVYVGAPYAWGGYYPPPVYYAYPPVVVAPAAPPVYIEQNPAPETAQSQQGQGYWYYCNNPDGYYPYIKECPGGWKRVEPTPPAQPTH